MRRLILAAALLVLAGCRPKPKTIIEDEAAALVQSIEMGSAVHAPQLLAGFFNIEDNRWRWTGRRFSANLRPPLRASLQGCTLIFEFTYPEPVAAKLGTIHLTAQVDSHPLPTTTYTKPGAYTFEARVPKEWLQEDAVKVEFTLDKALPPAGAEHRELGLIATRLGFRP